MKPKVEYQFEVGASALVRRSGPIDVYQMGFYHSSWRVPRQRLQTDMSGFSGSGDKKEDKPYRPPPYERPHAPSDGSKERPR
ncbi:hypothetical protein MSG28_008058 [Choristoneura fumiferana]|uniref:Uncharacterized protein n=1 Tax=Choristoneura fumiferana TaxID=7141 RepID=A0ACC0J9W8_CHOFU|nr:hypothetical protein MSG28_008058 [Choristoneura fumiferana]